MRIDCFLQRKKRFMKVVGAALQAGLRQLF
jgi:hypothetical protein